MRIRPTVSALVAALALSACSGDKTAGDGDGGGTLLVGMGGDASSLFPFLVGDETGAAATNILFEKLAKIDDELSFFDDRKFKPRLARSWDWAADSLAITFHLDPAARFHDGTPVKASDLRYAFGLAKDPALASPITSLIANIDSVTVIDSVTAKAWYKRRSPTQFYDMVYQVQPLPEHVYGKIPVAELRTSELTRNPVGTGRFRLGKWEPGVRLELVADTANFMGRPKLDRVVFLVNQSPTAATAAILAGQLDFYSTFPIDQVAALDSGTVARSIIYRQNGYGYLGLNLRARKSTRPHPILGDIAVRRAIAMSLDRRGMLTNIFKDAAPIAYGPFPTGSVLSDTTLRSPAYDTVGAKATLDAAGWRMGPNGIRVKNGQPLTLELLVPTSSLSRMRYADLIQEQLGRTGIRVELAQAPLPQFFPRMAGMDYDMIILAQNTDPTVAGVEQFWGKAGLAPGSNFLKYQSAVVDAHLDSASRAANLADMKRHTSAAFQRIMDDVPAVWLYSSGAPAALHRRVEPAPLGLDGWWGNLAEWSIPADRRIDRDRVGLPPATP